MDGLLSRSECRVDVRLGAAGGRKLPSVNRACKVTNHVHYTPATEKSPEVPADDLLRRK